MSRKNILTFSVFLILAGSVFVLNMNKVDSSDKKIVSQEVYHFQSTSGNISVLSFSSPHCSACTKQKKEVEIVQSELSGEAAFKIIDVTRDAQTPNYYDVAVVPTILITYKGMEVGRFTGIHKAGELENEIKKQIEKHKYCENGTLC